jgi:hypothetical protein
MPDILVLKQALATIEELARRYNGSPEPQDGQSRRKQVADRRAAMEMMTDVGAAGRRLITERGDEALLRKFEDCVARFRHTLALHQANWPVVAIKPDDIDYLRSRQGVHLANRDLTAMITALLA